MATYYRWRKSTVNYVASVDESYSTGSLSIPNLDNNIYSCDNAPNIDENGKFITTASRDLTGEYTPPIDDNQWVSNMENPTEMYSCDRTFRARISGSNILLERYQPQGPQATFKKTVVNTNIGTFVEYVYSTSSSAYPNGGVSGSYYYDQRTTVTSPSTPGNISYPMNTTSTSIQVSWGAASSETNYPVDHYELQRQINGGGWTNVNSNIRETSFTASLTSDTTTYRFRVWAVDTNGKSGGLKTGNTGTKINAPGAPSVSAPSEAVSGESITVNWGTVSGATSYTVQRNTGGNWTQVYSGNALTFSETVGVWDSLQYRVQGVNTAGGGSWGYSGAITVYTSPTLSVPSQLMQGQPATISWSAIEGADSYTLQRKANTDADWTQVYSGTALTFSETVGTWTSVQYRVQAVFDETPGGWATSDPIQIVSASALVISGTDGDLGTVVNDIPYSISTDTGNQITATITVNSAVIFSGNVGNSTSDTIPVLDLVNGEGTIVIEASVTASGGPVSAVRTWTYTKAAITFPDAGSVAQLTKEGENIFPKTLAECVRLPGGKTLDQVMGFPAQVYTGSYVGTGTSGSSNPNTLTFPFVPKFVFICGETTTPMQPGGGGASYIQAAFLVYNNPKCIRVGNGVGTLGNVQWEGNSVSWYSENLTSAPFYQLNTSGITYDYVALG